MTDLFSSARLLLVLALARYPGSASFLIHDAQPVRRGSVAIASQIGDKKGEGIAGKQHQQHDASSGPTAPSPADGASSRPTNEVVRSVRGMKHRRLGGSDIVVSELGLGTQRWVSTDFNAPDEKACYRFLDMARENGVNLIDTAEQYPIPSDSILVREGDTERLIGRWMRDRNVGREEVVIATKITGGRNVTPKNIKADCTYTCKLARCRGLQCHYSLSHS